MGGIVDDALGQLELIDPVGFQVIERGILGAEIIDGDGHAQFTQARQRVVVRPLGLGQCGLGDIEPQVPRGELPAGGGAQHGVDQFRAAFELRQGNLDRHHGRRHPLITPQMHLMTGVIQHPASERNDCAGFLRDRHKVRCRQQAAPGMLPEDLCLHAQNPAAVQINFRCVMQPQLIAFKGGHQFADQGHALGHFP